MEEDSSLPQKTITHVFIQKMWLIRVLWADEHLDSCEPEPTGPTDQNLKIAVVVIVLHEWAKPGKGQQSSGGTTHPENLSADVRYPVFLKAVPFCLLHQISDRASTTVLHHQLQRDKRNAPLPQHWQGTSTGTIKKHTAPTIKVWWITCHLPGCQMMQNLISWTVHITEWMNEWMDK